MLGDGATSVVHTGAGSTENDDASDDRFFDLTDGLSSIHAQSDDLGAVIATADFEVWGAEQTSTTCSVSSRSAEKKDYETRLTYLRVHYYSRAYGRFLSTAPIEPNAGATQGFNPDAYAQNNPATMALSGE